MANILIVDDSRTSRKLLRDILEEKGHTVIAEAVDGEDGYIKYKEFMPDIVTLDITMPKMDGIEALKLIMHENPDAKVVMITAAGQKNKMLEAIKIGASEFLPKPFSAEQIALVLEELSK